MHQCFLYVTSKASASGESARCRDKLSRVLVHMVECMEQLAFEPWV